MISTLDLVLAKPRGFCAGVDRAITIVERALDLYGPPIYIRHEIVHNPHVVRRLQQRGAIFVEDLEEVPSGAWVIFSAHGVSPAIREEAKSLGLRALDATCPLVTKVHLEAQRYAEQGFAIVLIGHRDHVEVQGTVGEAPDCIFVVSTVKEVENLVIPDKNKIAYLTQTTLSLDDTAEIVSVLKKKFPNIQGPSKEDICYATQNRQNAVKAMTNEVDLILVLGAPNSSNTLRLVEVAQASGILARRIESAEEILPGWLEGISRIGITAGASAPEDIVQDIIKTLKALSSNNTLKEMILVEENVTFALPSILKSVPPSNGKSL
ncbi:MAG: 4-hydroxy-3-methylbut-2-enyl diphosphate reductase [SAR324 cluster bacterium]|nr:4-hydroxy-3-methylbut-2-enyl diphosphate reductase [SAR324 cluster bacterium]